MTIDTFMCVTNPKSGSYPYLQAIESHLSFSDNFFLVDGGSTDGSLEEIEARFGNRVDIVTVPWPQGVGNWKWEQFSTSWNFGYNMCESDWVFAGECDHVFEPEEAAKVREAIDRHGKNRRVLFVDKFVSSTWYKWHNKSKFAYALNKGQFKDMGYGVDLNTKSPQDLANPIEVLGYSDEIGIPFGNLITAEDGWNMGVHFLNYDKTFKTREQILNDRESANWAWNNSCLVKLGLMPSWAEEDIVEDVLRRMVSRYDKSTIQRALHQHPESMRDMLRDMTPDMLGYDLFHSVPAFNS